MNQSEKCLVTGAAGFIGFHLARKLQKTGAQVICVDNYSRGKRDKSVENFIKNSNVLWIEGDLNENSFVERLPEEINYVFHLATVNGTGLFYSKPFEVFTSTILPTLNLIRKYGKVRNIKRFFLAGSSESYASITHRGWYPIPTDEKVPLGIETILNNRWSYGSGKLAAEAAIAASGSQFGVNWTVGRFHNVYGPRMGDNHFIPDFIERIAKDQFELHGWQNTRAFTYIDDILDQVINVTESEKTLKSIINLGSENEIRIIEIAKLILDICGISKKITVYNSPEGSAMRRCPDMTLYRTLIGNYSETPLRIGLSKTIEWYAPQLLKVNDQ